MEGLTLGGVSHLCLPQHRRLEGLVSAAEVRDLLADPGLEAGFLVQKTQHLLFGLVRATRFGAAGRGVSGLVRCCGILNVPTMRAEVGLFA